MSPDACVASRCPTPMMHSRSHSVLSSKGRLLGEWLLSGLGTGSVLSGIALNYVCRTKLGSGRGSACPRCPSLDPRLLLMFGMALASSPDVVLISEKSVGDCMAIFHWFDDTALASAISALTVTLFKKGPLWGNRRLPYVTVISEIDVQIELLMVLHLGSEHALLNILAVGIEWL